YGEKAGVLHFSQVWPLKKEHFEDYLKKVRKVYFVESNATRQLARLIESEMKDFSREYILRYDGLPLDAEYILERIQEN
ncbi:MAG: 2-oxoacid:acceptor oxidoreductase subunit alpha, partial [Desulfovibrionales bacterium]|nr:2-oxoacid:acceptor oxidoreductase subunit alpha [Desulfovibrionales bacterium]